MTVAAEQLTEMGERFVILRDIVIDPHPPAWIHLGNTAGKGLEQFKEPRGCVIWLTIFSKPDQMNQGSLMTKTKLTFVLSHSARVNSKSNSQHSAHHQEQK